MEHDEQLAVQAISKLDATFDALVFDWDGTAVPDRSADASTVRSTIEALCSAGVHVFVVSGTHVGNVDSQLGARPEGPGGLFLCLNRGSEVFEVTRDGPTLLERRVATPQEDAALDRAAQLVVEALTTSGITARVVSQRLNRRKIDLIPDPAWADPPKARIAELAEAVGNVLRASDLGDLSGVVALAIGVARESGLDDPRVTSDVKHVEIGLTDKSDSARFAARWLAERGITGGLVLVAGDEFGSIGGVAGSDSLMMIEELSRSVVVSVGIEPNGTPEAVLRLPGGPARFMALLEAQLLRRAERRVPKIDEDPAWVVALPTTTATRRAAEAMATLETIGNGWAGTRGSIEEGGRGANPLFVVGGVYAEGGRSLLAGPLWTGLEVRHENGRHGAVRRLLDMRTGTLVRLGEADSDLRSMRFVSGSTPYALALRAEGDASLLDSGDALRRPAHTRVFDHERRADVQLARSGEASEGGIAMAARDWVRRTAERCTIERLCAWDGEPHGPASYDVAVARLAEAEAAGFDLLLAEHRRAWTKRWSDAEVVIEGCPDDELAARFSVFHLLSTAGDSDEAAVGARGLSGSAYGGHVFWDADVFVLPALVALHPASARAMLEYRVRRLPAARAAAAASGHKGARFPWESAAEGTDVTPRFVRDDFGRVIPIRTGQCEEHITADIAWAACHYAAWSGDDAFIRAQGRDLLVETARYWASRIRVDHGGAAHIFGVIGPDEYHEPVDDNSYTNMMARWNLRAGAKLLEESGEHEEAHRWLDLAECLVDGWREDLRIYEQFAGYFALEPLQISKVAPSTPVAIDVLLGPERVASSQLIKQADVLMAHHLLPDEVERGSLGPCLEFYEPRTAHGSSLSPAIHASLLARAGEPDRALRLFRIAARLDLDDLTGTTAGGLHLAAMGGTWQALAFGFLGLRPHDRTLEIDPCLPAAWDALGLRFRFRGARVAVRADREQVEVDCDRPLEVSVGGGPPLLCEPPGRAVAVDLDARKGSLR